MNERSHRLDWALLLPASADLPVEEVLVLGGSDEMAQSLVDQELTVRWRRRDGPEDRSSFVVAWADCRLEADQVGRHVAANGILYMEVDRRIAGRRTLGMRSARRALGRVGCRVYSAHTVTPDLARPRRYLPMDHARAIRWHLRSLFIAGTPVTRAVRVGLTAALVTPLANAVLSLVTMRYIVIGTTVDDHSSPVGVPTARGQERAIVVTSGYDKASRAVVLPFGPGDRAPRCAVKVASNSRTTRGTLREHERLIQLHACLPLHTARALPKPIGMYSVAARTACVQSCAPGPSMSVTVGRWGRPLREKYRDLEVVVDWLTEFAIATRVDVASAERDWKGMYREAADLIDLPPEVAEFLGEAESIASSTDLGESAVHQHYDAGPWNVHIDRAGPLLIDWETDDLRPSDCLGPPLADVLYLVTYWYFLTSGAESDGEEDAAIVRLFATWAPVDGAVIAARQTIDRALLRLGLEWEAVPAVLAALWAERAVYTHRRRASLGVPIEAGRSRPEAYLRVLAGVMPAMRDMMVGDPSRWVEPRP